MAKFNCFDYSLMSVVDVFLFRRFFGPFIFEPNYYRFLKESNEVTEIFCSSLFYLETIDNFT